RSFPGPEFVLLAAPAKLAVAPDAHPLADAGVPDIAVGRGRDVAVGVAHGAPAFAQVRAATMPVVHGPDLLDECARIRTHGKRVTALTDLGIDVEVVEQHDVPRQGVRVRCDVFAEKAQAG